MSSHRHDDEKRAAWEVLVVLVTLAAALVVLVYLTV